MGPVNCCALKAKPRTRRMLWPLLLMFLGFALYFITVLLIRLRAELLRRERNASWVREVLT